MKTIWLAMLWILMLSACAPEQPQVGMQATVQAAIAQTETSVAQTKASVRQTETPVPPLQPQTIVSTITLESTPQTAGISIPAMLETLASLAKSGRFVVPDDGYVYMQVKHDFETDLWSNQPRAFHISGWDRQANPQGGFPDTFPCATLGDARDHVRLTEPFQWLWFDLLDEASKHTIPDAILKERWAKPMCRPRSK